MLAPTGRVGYDRFRTRRDEEPAPQRADRCETPARKGAGSSRSAAAVATLEADLVRKRSQPGLAVFRARGVQLGSPRRPLRSRRAWCSSLPLATLGLTQGNVAGVMTEAVQPVVAPLFAAIVGGLVVHFAAWTRSWPAPGTGPSWTTPPATSCGTPA